MEMVVCINAKPIKGFNAGLTPDLIEGAVYSVEARFITKKGNPALLLAGKWSNAKGGAYAAIRFRPLRPNEAATRESWAEMLANPAKVRV